jgi:thiamine biosynthesis lipoprotein
MQPHKVSFDAIGTKWHIESMDALSDRLLADIRNCVETYDQTYSRFRSDSLVTEISQRAGVYKFSDDSIELMELYRILYDLTDGYMTPLIGSMLEKAGYDANYSFTPRQQTALPAWNDAMEWDRGTVTTTRPILIDIGAAGKGHLIDKVGGLLTAQGVDDYVIDAGGDILHKGECENIVGLEHPLDTSKIIGTIPVQNASICASASNRRIWGDGMHHIFDPYTMQPTRKITATWVVAKSAMIADGIATALFITNP